MENNKGFTSRQIALYGLFIALVYIATRWINIPGPTAGGLFHLGNVMAFTIAIVFGKRAGAISGAVGMALFDLTSGFAVWAPATFIIRFLMGYIIGYLTNDEKLNINNNLKIVIAMIISSIIMILGYYIAEVIIYGNWIAPIQSLWGNFTQCIVGSIGAIPISLALKSGFKARKILVNNI